MALAVFADGRRRVVVENGAGEVVDHQHLPLQRVLDQEGHAIQPLTFLEHTYTRTYAPGHVRTHTGRRPAKESHAHMRTCKDMEHAGKRHLLLNRLVDEFHAGQESHVLMHPPVKATSASDKQTGQTSPPRNFGYKIEISFPFRKASPIK